MKKIASKKLRLSKDTFRRLAAEDLHEVAGAGTKGKGGCGATWASCPATYNQTKDCSKPPTEM